MTSTPRGKPASAKRISLQVAVPRIVMLDGEEVSTGIFKTPVLKRVQMRALNLDGDRQADLWVHGGRDKAVYAYPSEHYADWKKELPGTPVPWARSGKISQRGDFWKTKYSSEIPSRLARRKWPPRSPEFPASS